MQAEEVVNQFCAAFSAGDLHGAMRHVADDCVYHNIPLEPVVGAAAIRETIAFFFSVLGTIRFETLHQVAQGALVMNERLDHFSPPRGLPYSLPVAGVFEIRDGKIKAWRDYFDIGQIERGTGLKF
jgi:limonene-1,2-epoxide hydrolase